MMRYDADDPPSLREPVQVDAAATLRSPQAWCRRVLMALQERSALTDDVGDLPMLLAYFIELDPSPELFTGLLARCVSDPRPGVANSARVLQRSWERGLSGADVLPAPPLTEVLRTLGALLDASNVRGAYLAVTPDRVRLQVFGEHGVVEFGPHELHQEIAAYTALRGQVPAADPTGAVRHETRLRAVGQLLDGEPSQVFDVAVMPGAIVVEGSAGYVRVLAAAELASLVQTASQQRDHGHQAP